MKMRRQFIIEIDSEDTRLFDLIDGYIDATIAQDPTLCTGVSSWEGQVTPLANCDGEDCPYYAEYQADVDRYGSSCTHPEYDEMKHSMRYGPCPMHKKN